MCLPLEAQPHLVGQSVQQQHRLPPGCVDLIPLHWDTGESTQTEVVDGTKLTAVPKNKQTNSDSQSVNRHWFIFVHNNVCVCVCACTRCEMWH